jgi:hypothetical protein
VPEPAEDITPNESIVPTPHKPRNLDKNVPEFQQKKSSTQLPKYQSKQQNSDLSDVVAQKVTETRVHETRIPESRIPETRIPEPRIPETRFNPR